MAERMRSAADIIAEMKRKFSEAFEGANGQECISCRVTFKVFKSFPERFTVRDRNGNPIANVPYRIFADNREICSGRTNAAGQTSRVATQGFKFLKIDVEG